MTTQKFTASMLLLKKGEPAENARKNYEMRKKELERWGLTQYEYSGWDKSDDLICLTGSQIFYPFSTKHHKKSINGHLLEYNPPLLFAIAGQRPGHICEGQYWIGNQGGKYLIKIRENVKGKTWWYTQPKVGLWTIEERELQRDFHLATIPELIAAFPCEEGAYQNQEQVGPEPEESELIKKCNEALALSDEYLKRENITDEIKRFYAGRGYYTGYTDYWRKTNEEAEPVKEERDWRESTKIEYQGCRVFIDKTGIYLDCHNGDMAELIRYALQRHDQLKQQ